MNKILWKVLVCCCLGITACGSSNDNGKDGGGSDTDAAADDSATTDTLPEDDSSPPDAPPDAQSDGQADVEDDVASPEWVIRKPNPAVLCNEEDGIHYPQIDHVCTYDYDGVKGLIYVQATPKFCWAISKGKTPVNASIDLALIKIGDTVDELDKVTYEYDGNHFADRLTFDYKNVRFVYSHASVNGAYMSCQNMNCAIIKDTEGKLIDNGCRPQRTRPIVCERVAEDGTYDESMKDTYVVCPGDPGSTEHPGYQ